MEIENDFCGSFYLFAMMVRSKASRQLRIFHFDRLSRRRKRTVVAIILFAVLVIVNTIKLRPLETALPSEELQFTEARNESQPQIDQEVIERDEFSITDDALIEDALEGVLATLPGEGEMRRLLQEIQESGKERLYELGLRTRIFKKLFDRWEALHLVPIGNTLYIRDDVIQFLRSRETRISTIPQLALAGVIRRYESFRSFIHQLGDLLFPSTAPYFADLMTLHTQLYSGGRGIVLSAGNNHALDLVTSIRLMRELGCHLPVEIMYLGDVDLNEDSREQLERLPGVITRDIRQMVNDDGWQIRGWAGKPWAILLSSFREVIFIDADALFFQSPETLFQDPGYARTGALFFHDRLMMKESKKEWLEDTLPEPISEHAQKSRFWTGQSAHMQESGVIVVDKWKHFVSLLLVARMNGPDRDGNKEKGVTGVYDMLYGDKETFWIGWELSGDVDYTFHEGAAGVMGIISPDNKKRNEDKGSVKETAANNTTQERRITICAPQLLHLTPNGVPLWFNGGILENKFNKKDIKLQRFEQYMQEPPNITEPEAWKLGKNNMCCLTGHKTFTFTENEKRTLDMVYQIAADVGGYSPAHP